MSGRRGRGRGCGCCNMDGRDQGQGQFAGNPKNNKDPLRQQ